MTEPPGPPVPPGPPGPPGGYDSAGGYGEYGPPGQDPRQPGAASWPVPTNGRATAALVTGVTTLVLSWCCGFGVLGLVAVGLGVAARSEIRRSGGTQSGDGVALAGIVTGAVAALVGVLVLAVLGLLVLTGQAAFQDYPGMSEPPGRGDRTSLSGPRGGS